MTRLQQRRLLPQAASIAGCCANVQWCLRPWSVYFFGVSFHYDFLFCCSVCLVFVNTAAWGIWVALELGLFLQAGLA